MNPQNINPNQPAIPPEQARAMAAANMQRPPMSMPSQAQQIQPVQPQPIQQAYGAPNPQPQPAIPIAQPQMAAPQPQVQMQPQAPQVQPTQQIPQAPQMQPVQQPIAGAPTMVESAQATENPLSTQATLLFSELRDGLIIMKDGSFRAVVACQSINFDLMSEQEREGVEYSYQNFLNSLNFNIQILVRSQRVDIGPYIEKLTNIRRNNDNMLLGILMDDYINFIDELAREANIMDKSFFIVIPYYPSADLERAVEDTKNFFKALSKNKAQGVTRINRDVYDKAVDELNNRVESVVSGLFQIGIQSIRLRTRELSQLFYNFNNPDTAVREPLVDFSQMATTYVRKGTKNE